MIIMNTEFEVPNCLFCIHNLNCPVGYSRCNAACLTIYKNSFKESDKVLNHINSEKDHPNN